MLLINKNKYLDKIKGSDKIKKSITLFASMTLSVFAGIFVSILNTRFLGKEQYGDFKFLIDIFNFFITFLTFGLFYSGGRILAKTNDVKLRKKIFGEIISIALFIGVILILILFIFSFYQERIFDHDLKKEIWLCLPFLVVLPLQLTLEQLLTGDNRIYSLSVLRIGPKLTYIAIVLILYYLTGFNLKYALIAHFSAFLFIITSIIIRYQPIFSYKFIILQQLKKENKNYGFPLFIGNITGVASNYLAGISISYFIDNTHVGFYSLALTASMPLAMLPASFGITLFKDFIRLNKIPKKVITFTFIIAFFVLFVFLFFIDKIIILLYSKEFSPTIELTYFIAIGSLFHGLGDFFNKFLSAKGLGKKLRNSNIVLGLINIIGYTSLVYYFDAKGAAITKLISGISYLFIILNYYFKYLKDAEG